MRSDPTTAETRLADWLLGIVPSTTDRLTQLAIGGYFSSGKLWALHSRLRYFDPEMRRAGLPKDMAALVEKLTDDSVTVTLVNLDPISPRSLIVQAGGYREHEVRGRSKRAQCASSSRREPGSGSSSRCGATLPLRLSISLGKRGLLRISLPSDGCFPFGHQA